MSGNSFGKIFKVTTFGESHGEAIGCIIDGCPPKLELSAEKIQPFLDKRKPGQSKYTSQRRESDKVRILSGVFEGLTTGTPIMLIIENHDAKIKDYDDIKDLFRPGHADYTYQHKYGHRDYRGGGRASARETAARVAAGAVARLYLQEKYGVEFCGFLRQIGNISIENLDEDEINNNPFFCPNNTQLLQLQEYIDDLRRQNDSIGALVEVHARNVPVGLGEPVFDKLDATIAHAMMSINAVKAVEIGAGFAVVNQLGSEHRDEITKDGFLSNNAGGILGGIANGEDIIVRLAFKPASSIPKPGRTINKNGEDAIIITKGRHDPCVGIRGVPVAEAMLALVLMDSVLLQRAQNIF